MSTSEVDELLVFRVATRQQCCSHVFSLSLRSFSPSKPSCLIFLLAAKIHSLHRGQKNGGNWTINWTIEQVPQPLSKREEWGSQNLRVKLRSNSYISEKAHFVKVLPFLYPLIFLIVVFFSVVPFDSSRSFHNASMKAHFMKAPYRKSSFSSFSQSDQNMRNIKKEKG